MIVKNAMWPRPSAEVIDAMLVLANTGLGLSTSLEWSACLVLIETGNKEDETKSGAHKSFCEKMHKKLNGKAKSSSTVEAPQALLRRMIGKWAN